MSVLLFRDGAYFVVTAAWTAAAKAGNKVEICYQWGAHWISFMPSATGIASTTLNITMDQFAQRVADGGGVVDLIRFSE